MSKTVLVGCKLPSGIVLDGPKTPILLNGQNTALIPGAPGLTHVEENTWAYLQATYGEHSAFKSNSIFSTGTASVADVSDAADDLAGEKTGFEGLDPENPAKGLIPEDAAKLAKAKSEAKTTTKKAQSKADRAAAVELASAKA